MIRPVLTEIGIFLIPFAVYALFLAATRTGVWTKTAWPMRLLLRLAVAAVVLVVISLFLFVHFTGAPPNSTYVPAHIENGKLVPGTDK